MIRVQDEVQVKLQGGAQGNWELLLAVVVAVQSPAPPTFLRETGTQIYSVNALETPPHQRKAC